MRQKWLAFALLLVTFVCYYPVLKSDFINFDDDEYVTANRQLQQGITPASIKWAFTTGHASNWHPLTWLSLMLDYELFALKPGGYHFMNLLMHMANVLLLFVVLQALSGHLWPSALAAAIFAVHPLHVESVAWISERKDLLSTLLALVAMGFYLRYTRDRSSRNYLLLLVAYVLSLMAKPMYVTLPFLLLLLDYWPLGRWQPLLIASQPAEPAKGRVKDKRAKAKLHVPVPLKSLILEKLPLVLLAALSSVVTFLVQQSGGATASLQGIDLSARIGNALVSYVRYLGKMVWFGNLAVLYPHPREWPVQAVFGAAFALALISGIMIWRLRRNPWLAIGWFWFLGMLIPVIGFVQVGFHSMADRYSYFPSIGLLVVVCWSIPRKVFETESGRTLLAGIATVVIITLGIFTRIQVGYWQNSITLFQHAVNVTENNTLARSNLAGALMAEQKIDQALEEYKKMQADAPNNAEAYNNMGKALMRKGQIPQALEQFQKALVLAPNSADVHNNLGAALASQGNVAQAIEHYRKAIAILPNSGEAYNNLGAALVNQGDIAGAIEQYQKAISLMPESVEAHNNLGVAFANLQQLDQAIEQFQIAVRLRPDHQGAKDNLMRALALKQRPPNPR